MIWLIEEQLAYALGKSVGNERVMQQAETCARWRYFAMIAVLPLGGYFALRHLTK